MKNISSRLGIVQQEPADIGKPIPVTELQTRQLLVTLVICAVAFLVAYSISQLEVLHQIDIDVSEWFARRRSPMGDAIVVVITMLGDTPVQIFAFCACAVSFLPQRRIAIYCLVTGLLASTCVTLSKDALDIARPVLVVNLPSSPSFPSGHAAGFSSMIAFAWIFLRRLQIDRRYLIDLVCVSLIALMACSRMYLGVHWFSDVSAGIALGTFISVCIWLWLDHSGTPVYPVALGRSLVVFASLMALMLAIYAYINFTHDMQDYLPKVI